MHASENSEEFQCPIGDPRSLLTPTSVEDGFIPATKRARWRSYNVEHVHPSTVGRNPPSSSDEGGGLNNILSCDTSMGTGFSTFHRTVPPTMKF